MAHFFATVSTSSIRHVLDIELCLPDERRRFGKVDVEPEAVVL